MNCKISKVFFGSITFLLIVLTASCSSISSSNLPADVEAALQRVGDNRGELEQIIENYSKNESDSVKLKASYYLVKSLAEVTYLESQ